MLRGKEGKPPIQKPLCRLCECPTSDGHVLASQVDRFKLRTWAMKVMNLTEEDENLPEMIGEDALICYFCIWQAEFGDESGDEAVAWWPKNLDLEKNARVLRENYSVGEVEQCWVQLEEVDLAKYTKESPEKRKFNIDLANYEKEQPKKSKTVRGVCFYCGKMYNSLMNHIKYSHKEAIKCGILGCATFFHTEEEKEQHMQQVSHEKRSKPCKSKEIRCKYCESDKLYSTLKSLRLHMKRLHPEFSMRCSRVGCQEFFKSKSEMVAHINSWHKRGQKQRVLQCKQCEYFTRHDEHILRRHVESKHMPKTFKCDRCDAKFGSKAAVDKHFIQFHTFVNCKTCGQDVALGHKPYHGKPSVCYRCKLRFKCSGLYQSHREKCKQTLLTCKECGKSFPVDSRLKNHVKNVHTKTLIFRCEHCEHSTHDKIHMQGHMQRKHLPKTIKCELCDKSFATESLVNIHKSAAHSFIHCAECAQQILRVHKSTHMSVKTCRRCKCKFKCQGLLEIHSNKSCQNNNYCCDMCQKYFKNKADLYSHMVNNHIRVYK